MASVGERLRCAREQQNLSVEDLADEMRIHARYLAAIEADNLDELPSSFFVRSFVRQYANRLGVPMEELTPDLDRWFANPASTDTESLEPKTMNIGVAPVTHVVDGNPKPRRKLLGALLTLVVVICACAAIYSFWLQRQQQEPPLAQLVQEPPPLEETEPEVQSAARELASGIGEMEPAEEPLDAPAAAGIESSGTDVSPAETRRQDGPIDFEIAAVEEVWVRVKTGDETLYVGILNPGEKRRFSGLRLATVRIGNAGGLRVAVHGRDIGSVGAPGQIRILTITPDKTEITSPERIRPTPIPEDIGDEAESSTTEAQ